MAIFLGNLTPEQLEKRVGVILSDSDRKWLKDHRQEQVNKVPLEDGKLHIFDIPLMVMCATQETAVKVRDMFMAYGSTFKETFQIGWER